MEQQTNLRRFFFNFLFIYDSHREREAETQAEGEAGSMHWDDWEPDVGFDPGSPGSHPGPKAGAKPLHHPGIPTAFFQTEIYVTCSVHRRLYFVGSNPF